MFSISISISIIIIIIIIIIYKFRVVMILIKNIFVTIEMIRFVVVSITILTTDNYFAITYLLWLFFHFGVIGFVLLWQSRLNLSLALTTSYFIWKTVW